MGIETIKGAATAYQGSVQTADVSENRSEVEQTAEAQTKSEPIATSNTTVDSDSDVPTQPQTQTQGQAYQKAQIKKAIEDINKKATSSEAIFGIHEATNRVTIKIVDKETKEVIKELPPEKTLDMIAKVWEMAGILVDEKR
jgi:flagellar protein FlaG